MVNLVLLAVFTQPAAAQAVTVSPTVAVVGGDEQGVRPGVRVGFEPMPAAAVELSADSSVDGYWDAGLGIAGRAWLTPSSQEGEGIFLLGRFNAGFSGVPGDVGPWTGFYGGFGARPAWWLNIEASAGPEWLAFEGVRWRTELTVGMVIDGRTTGGKPGQGSVRHKPRPIPGR